MGRGTEVNACPEKERKEILVRLRKYNRPESQLAYDSKRLDGILAEARRRGYATRDDAGLIYGGLPYDDGLAAIDDLARCVLQIGKMLSCEFLDGERLLDPKDIDRAVDAGAIGQCDGAWVDQHFFGSSRRSRSKTSFRFMACPRGGASGHPPIPDAATAKARMIGLC
jgi:hypothetical protein